MKTNAGLVLVVLGLFVLGAIAMDAGLTRGAGSREAFELVRLPRALVAALAGAVFAASGVTLQGILRNDLASPFTLGIASGATLGAAIVIRFRLDTLLFGLPTLVFAALLGALVTTAIVYVAARRLGMRSAPLVLAGVGIAMLVNTLVTTLFLIGEVPRYEALMVWTLGNLQQVGYDGLRIALPGVLVGGGGLAMLLRDLNAAAFDDPTARALGVDVKGVRSRALIATSLMLASLVAVVGPIGFVGLIIPHAVRRILGPDARIVLPAATLLGASFLPLCDLVARSIVYPAELPVGVVTGLIGSPIFIAILLRK